MRSSRIGATKLFNYAYDNYTLTKVKEPNTVIETIEIENGNKETKTLNVLIDSEINLLNSLKEGLLYFLTYSNPPSFFSFSFSPVTMTPTSGTNLSKFE